MSNKYDKFVNKALNKMFTYVGFEGLDKEFTKQEDWYTQRTWTQEQSDDFKQWFLAKAKKDLKLPKTMAEKEYSWFDMMWGWKLESK